MNEEGPGPSDPVGQSGPAIDLRLYRATGAVITTARRLLRVHLRVHSANGGAPAQLPSGPLLFAVNHFTRLETVIIPYVIYHLAGRAVRSLTTESVFHGLLGKYMRAVGGISVRDPRRNRTIVSDLLTGRHDWVIYPEGGLIKNKRVVQRGRLHLDNPRRQGPPHTGAAMLTLKAEIIRRRFQDAWARGDEERLRYYREAYGLLRPEDLCPQPVHIVPLTVTFYPLRPVRNPLSTLARLLLRPLDPRIEEELLVDGGILFGRRSEITVHVGEPIDVARSLDGATELARRLVGLFNESRRDDLLLRRQAARLTEQCMRRIYGAMEVNFDHLFCHGLRALRVPRLPMEDFHRAIYLAAMELRRERGIVLHPLLRNGITPLLTGEHFAPLEDIRRIAIAQGALKIEDGHYVIDRGALERAHDFHRIRLDGTVQVIANELEALEPAARIVARSVNMPGLRIRDRASRSIREHEILCFQSEYRDWFDPEQSKIPSIGEPFFLPGRPGQSGVLLVHGYLASPEQMRPLALHLQRAGFSVYAPRLDGHGTAPHHMTAVTWRGWMRSVLHGHAVLRQHCPVILAGGFSLGGCLALLLAAREPRPFDGVFTINAPLRLRDPRAPLVGALDQWNRAMRRLRLARGPARRAGHRSESPELSYATDYLSSVRELRRAMAACRRQLDRVHVPALIIQGDADPVVAPGSGTALLAALGSRDRTLLELPFDRHLIVRGEGSEVVFEAVERFVQGRGVLVKA